MNEYVTDAYTCAYQRRQISFKFQFLGLRLDADQFTTVGCAITESINPRFLVTDHTHASGRKPITGETVQRWTS